MVEHVRHALDELLVHQRGDLFEQLRLVHLVGNLGDHDLLSVLADFFDRGLGAQLEMAAAPGIRVDDSLPAEDEPAGREVRPGHHFEDLRERRSGMLHQLDRRIDHFGQVMRRNVGRHANRDAGRTVHQQVRHSRRQHFRLLLTAIVVRFEIDGVLVDVFEHRRGHPRHARFGVPGGRRRVAIHRTEVALPVNQRIAHREILGQADQRIVDGHVAVRMILAHAIADDAGALAGGLIGSQAHLLHRVKNAPMHRLQPVANVRQRTADDHAHGVIQIAAPHLLFDVDRDEVLVAVAARRSGQRQRPAGWRRRRTLRW